ncbi:MAG: response regulator transcription factor [Niameybacter sp.]|uniref:response regulator transcription factor n=1 Tax=Niameybacter sp. TaxID=2033640 RepID=UPI002FC6BDE4
MRILFVEDDQTLCDAVSFHLINEGYLVDVCYDGADALYFIRQEAYDLILLDRMLPSLDGLALLKRIRALSISTPIILVTALDGVGDRITGLDAGADDYLVKPYAIAELSARIRALSRRPTQWESLNHLGYGDITLDLAGQSLKGPSHSCSLSKRESQLAEVLLKNPGQTLPRAMILARIWGPDADVEEGNLDSYIHFLRRRLHTIGSTLQIKTVRSVGYTLENSIC